MKIIKVSCFHNMNTQVDEYRIILFGFIKIKRNLFYEQTITEKYPSWHRWSRYLLQNTCNHKYEKHGNSRLDGIFLGDRNYVFQDYLCRYCAKKITLKHRWGIDTPY